MSSAAWERVIYTLDRLGVDIMKRFSLTIASILATAMSPALPAQSQSYPLYCQQSTSEISIKNASRKASLAGDTAAQKRYGELVTTHAKTLINCRRQNDFKTQGIWLRLYPCDARPGAIEELLDNIVNRGYNEVFVETFFNGQVLLPVNQNPTAWRSVMAGSGQENVDLLREVITKGRARGLKVTSWLFALNVGTEYVQKTGKQGTIARNGKGQTTIETNLASRAKNATFNPDQAFADPYHPVLRKDFLALVELVVKYQPDGIVFDYIRYQKGSGPESVVNTVKDLWVYGEASQLGLMQRAINNRGKELISRYLKAGKISAADVVEVDRLYPQEAEPKWHGSQITPEENKLPAERRAQIFQIELWRLAAGHAMQGIVDYVTLASVPVQNAKIPVGAAFFPDGNQMVGRGYDSRLQMWNRFPETIDRYPMAYGTCGKNDCIMDSIQRVLNSSRNQTIVKPVIAGIWQQSYGNRPALDVQMREIRQRFPYLTELSHFSYAWQEPASDRDRKTCRLP